MEQVWASAPTAALRVWPAAGGLRVEPNRAARAWATQHALADDTWRTVAELLASMASMASSASASAPEPDRALADQGAEFEMELPAGVVSSTLRCRWVTLPDGGAVVWIIPVDATPLRAPRGGGDEALAARAGWPAEAARAGLVAEAVGVGFWSRDGDTGAAYWDDQLHRIHGRPLSEGPPALADWIPRHVHADDQAWMQALQDRTQAEWAPVTDASFRLQDSGGGERWVQSWTRRIVRDGRRLAFGMHLDITDRQRSHVRLEHERDRQQFAINAAQIGVWERSADGGVIYWNAAMYRLRGLDPRDRRSCDELLALTSHPDDHALMMAATRHHLASAEPFRIEYRVRASDGGWRWLVTEGRALRDGSGRVLGSAGVNIDITERKRADALLLEKLRAEQASRDKSAFMARLSHELRTPMNAVLGFAQLLDDDAGEPPSERQRGRLQRIRDAGTQLMALIDDVLDLARLDTETNTVESGAPTVSEVISGVVTALAPLAARHGQQLQVGPLPAGVGVHAETRRVVQALAHGVAQLLRDLGEPGSVQVNAVLQATEAGDVIVFEVFADGRAPATLFGPQAVLPDGADTIGVGLSLSRSIVESLGGRLDVGHRLGPGFSLRLPALPVPGAGVLPSGSVPQKPLTVLCVEDNPVNMLLVRELLSKRPGLDMLSAVDGQSGIALGLEGRPDIALLDLQLPDLNGVDVLQRLRAEPSLAHCRFVALSANAMPADIESALSAGFDEYWTKPIDFGLFLAGIDRLAASAGAPGR